VIDMEIKAHKGAYGWEARNTIPIPELGENKAVVILTMKRYGGALTTSAQVATVEGYRFTFEMFGDYRENLIVNRAPRVTEKAVKEQQATALQMIPQVIANAKTYYADQQKKLKAEGPFTVLAGA
jgi:hypothetical protein